MLFRSMLADEVGVLREGVLERVDDHAVAVDEDGRSSHFASGMRDVPGTCQSCFVGYTVVV